jgi:hypothetical protein
MHHFMLQVGAMQDVGAAYERCLDAGVHKPPPAEGPA